MGTIIDAKAAVTLPATATVAEPIPAQAPRNAGGGILVVDDTQAALHLMVELLGRAGYAVRPASTGELALRSALRNPPELVLLDVQLPGIDGFEVCRRLKADPRTSGVPVVFLSALNDTVSRVKGLEVGGQDFISKPIQTEELLARVRTHLILTRTMHALDEICIDLQQRVVERSNDLADVSGTLAQVVAEHRTTAHSLQLASRALESAHDAIVISDANGVVISANPASLGITGYSLQEFLGMRVSELFREDQPGAAAAERLLTGQELGEWAGELSIRRRDGSPLPVWISFAEFRGTSSEVTNHVTVFSDISERKASEERIRFLAEHDLLTGLPNRLLLQDRFNVARAAAMRDHERLALLFIDVDKFKSINDSMGHDVGDAYLRGVSSAIATMLRGSDALCRVGGDEFLALAGGISSVTQVNTLAQRIRRQLDAEIVVDGHPIRRTVSIGIALYPDDGDDFDELARKSDTAMYLAKRAGRNAVLFHTEQMNLDLQNRIILEQALRTAIAEEQLVMAYQPQVDLESGRILGLEALVRWNRPDTGEIQPGSFISIAEEFGLIVDLGMRTFTMVCTQAREWMDAGIAVPVSVNLSPVEIWHGGVEAMILEVLETTGLPGSLLEIEVTESGLIDDTPKTQEMVARLRDLGVRLSIDDFLTGYSNFTYLRQFQPAHLKIDKSFVASLWAGSENQAIIRAAIQMADALGIPTIAEGVETQEQADLLREAGCRIGQGFLFARPLPADQVGPLLVRGYCRPGDLTCETAPSKRESHEHS